MSGAPCFACKYLGQECTYDCVLAPFFHAELHENFLNVHKVYGVSEVWKFLSLFSPSDRPSIVSNIVLLANATILDPINGRDNFYHSSLLKNRDMLVEFEKQLELAVRNTQSAILPIGSSFGTPFNEARIQSDLSLPMLQHMKQMQLNNEKMSHAPCAACKYLGQECIYDCVFAPYFPAEQYENLLNVHEAYGGSGARKSLLKLNGVSPLYRPSMAQVLILLAKAAIADPLLGREQQDMYTALGELCESSKRNAEFAMLLIPQPQTLQQHPLNHGHSKKSAN